ncbi:hypothetical protein PMI16_04324 [Herbaspirillum sp. CF444]|uniref:hypothetical protein n=1 Tax=Herbaspirillum sp. CF444 TaxID=1144319 RepID=UPI0002725240|nr:hypothetical protein [Herbaspirillum sp. CF444]EJL83314.1 hypothetical protein PMI16_04324 [Herbaspirillum sp. CF444]
MEQIKEKVVAGPQQGQAKSKSDWAKQILILTLGITALVLEIFGINSGYLRYMAVVIVMLVATVGLEGFTTSYNQLRQANDKTAMKNRLKLSAEKASTIGVISLTFAVAMGLYNFDTVNSRANSAKFLSVQKQMVAKAKQLGCKLDSSDSKDCQEFHDALNAIWIAIWASDAKGIATGIDSLRTAWQILGIRYPRQQYKEFDAVLEQLDNLKYWSDTVKQQITVVFVALLLPFSVAATTRKLAVAAFDANFSDSHVTWRMVIKRIFLNAWRLMRFWKKSSYKDSPQVSDR